MQIDGVIVKKLTQISDERGKIMHMMRLDDPLFKGFGEIYFSQVYPAVVKGWHLHSQMTLNYAVVSGTIKLVLYDDRSDSASRGTLQEIFMGESDYKLVQVPPGVWNGFKGVGTAPALVANLASHPHSADEISRLDPFENHIPYDWSLKHR
ncbi:MAG TPA: dTDP-4-dehydrorhamnose 3,5-epimerase family protein [Candidatus Obscuribacter sp.]|mgnify:FL=1|nr:dTDP-4-dehydrorhamnose 3,5-epimerase family protein [Candidatus Obscuribacter sp.]MBK9282060.1 dTDP-4-dehydrorhamnose 3,5-epimerase family protein [Candidatus Obscuribacter sp.]MBL8082163.1 dTDP-4-dehydrorhamnose 3,5-epimerase family protein [Candidatus Obscuribacter sp.]HMW92645.1 dTDP-4-dehydrorhamnose 3,5-epimerase family protein [Candidatus Obscuribacter sp.]HMY54896.1 dTDP-4-dehydrorhamnose 3,5-epimerase family protein [Candidatus Obscuribacter sp.]